MSAQDSLGNPHSVTAPASRAAIDAFVHGFLANELGILDVLPLAEQEPAVLLQSYAALLQLFAETNEAPALAQPFLRRALDPATPALPRERLFAQAVAAWGQGEPRRAQVLLEALLCEHPRDLVALKLAQLLAFSQGDAPRMLRLALGSQAVAADVSHWHGLAAFGYEQCHRLGEAEAHARQALALDPHEPWAQHALAHVMLTAGRFAEGRDFLQAASPQWQRLNSFMRTHNWWHLALFHLELGEDEAALRLYDREVWGVDKRYSQDQIGAVSLLTRLELAGIAVGERWAELGGHLAARADDHVEPFLSLQYLLGLARAGRPEAAALLVHLQQFAPTAPADLRPVWQDLALPVGQGLLAFAEGDAETAQRLLGAALPRLADIGGSHAQRDLFEQVYIAALQRSGRTAAVLNLLQPQLNAAPQSQRLRRQMNLLNTMLGLP